MTTDARSRTPWRDHPVTRVFGSVLGWFGLALTLTLLVQATMALSDIGGFHARSGPFAWPALFVSLGVAPIAVALGIWLGLVWFATVT